MIANSEQRPEAGKGRPERREPSWRLPVRQDAPAFDASVWGGRFPQNRYFPFYLANGRDAVLINLSGSGDGHWERAPYAADVLGKLHAIGWFKADRREVRPDCGVYGPLICLGEFTACPRLHNDYLVPRDVRQYFDPKTATLTTFYAQLDDRTHEPIELRIETYLCANGVLIEEIEVLRAPESGLGYAFSLGSASPGYQNHMRPTIVPRAARLEEAGGGNEAWYFAEWTELQAAAFSLVGGAGPVTIGRRSLPGLAYEEMEQTVAGLPAGARFWRAVCFQDNREGGDPEAACATILKELRLHGIRAIRERHLLEWDEYFSRCAVRLPDPAAQHLYELSRYLLKANHHPQGFQPVGLLPYQWQGAMFWDATYVQEAFVQCGNAAEATAIGRQIRSLVPDGRRLARELGSEGARIEWTANLDSFTRYSPPSRQFHNNAVWARTYALIPDYLGEEPGDADIEAMEEMLRFLIGEYQQHGSARGQEFAFVGIDESTDDPKPYDTWTLAVLLKALEDYFAVCRKKGRSPVFSQGFIGQLSGLLDENVDADGVLQSFRGGRLPHWGSLVFELFPGHPSAVPTIRRMAENYDPEQDLFNFHGLNRYAEKTFPWATHSVARCLAKIGRPEAMAYFLHNLNHVNYFGGYSERLYYHGEHYIEWFSTAHAALVLALNTMLATVSEEGLRLLGGIDLSRWATLSFDGLHVGNGWVVSLHLHEGAVRKCTLKNLRPETRDLTVCVERLGLRTTCTALPGVNTVVF